MGPVFDRHLLRRWFHLPAFAVIALAATTAYVADRGVDAWTLWKVGPPHPEKQPATMVIAGHGQLRHLPADHIRFAASASATGKTAALAQRDAQRGAERIAAMLVDHGVPRTELRVTEGLTDTVESDPLPSDADPATIVGYTTTYSVEVQSRQVTAGLDAYVALSQAVPDGASVEQPECWAEESPALREKLRGLAWADLARQTSEVQMRLGKRTLVRVGTVSLDNSSVMGAQDTWTCTEGAMAATTVSTSYELR